MKIISTKAARHALLVGSLVLALASCGDDEEATPSDGSGLPAVTTAAESTPTTAAVSSTQPSLSQPPTTTDPSAATTEPSAATTEPSAATTEPSVEAIGEPIKAVLINDASDTDPYAGTVSAVEAATAAINASGGVNGRPLEITICSTQGDPNLGASCARDAAEDPDVVAIVGMFSSTGASVFPILEEAKMANIGIWGQAQVDYMSPMSFPASASTLGLVAGMVSLVVDVNGAKNIGLAFTDNPSGNALPLLLGPIVTARGATLVRETPIAPDVADMSVSVQSTTSGTDAVVLAMQGSMVARYVQSARGAGIDSPIVGPGNLDLNTLNDLGDAAEGLYVSDAFNRASDGFAQYASDMTTVGYEDSVPDLLAINTWVAVNLLKAAAESAGDTIDRESVLAAMQSMSGFELGGIVPPVDFTTPSPAMGGNFPRLVNTSVFYSQVINGVITPVDDEAHKVFP